MINMVTNSNISSWNDISLSQYIEIANLLSSDADDNMIEVISIILDIAKDDVSNMDYDDLLLMNEKFKFIYKSIPTPKNKSIKINDIDLYPIDYNKLEFGAFIDIEHYLSDTNNNLAFICAILFRKKIDALDSISNHSYEPYGDWVNIRAEHFYKMPITSLYYAISGFLSFRKNLLDVYSGMFNSDDAYEGDEIIDNEEEKQLTGKEREQRQYENNLKKWAWHLLLLKLANNEPLNISKATEVPIIEAMNILSMMQELKIGN